MPIEKPCEKCGQPFISYPSDNRRFCSVKCRSAFRFGTEIVESSQTVGRRVAHFTCAQCGDDFGMMQSYVDAYKRKYDRDPLYCSRKCSSVALRAAADQRNTFTCANCKETFNKSRKPGGRLYAEQKYCSPECKHEFMRKSALSRFEAGQNGRHIKRHGYVWLSVPSLVTGKKHAVLEHRYVMSKHIGRELLPDETVHHVNGNRQDNRIENLELFSSRHGPGQRVIDKVDFAIEMLRLYPEFARAKGVMLVPVPHDQISAATPP